MAEIVETKATTNELFVEERTVSDAMIPKPKIFRVKDSDSLLKAFQYVLILINTIT